MSLQHVSSILHLATIKLMICCIMIDWRNALVLMQMHYTGAYCWLFDNTYTSVVAPINVPNG